MIEQIIVTPVEGGFTIDLHGELGAILALVDGKQKLPDAERAGSSLSVVSGARNQRYLAGPRCMLQLPGKDE